jgi:hypothetical protein
VEGRGNAQAHLLANVVDDRMDRNGALMRKGKRSTTGIKQCDSNEASSYEVFDVGERVADARRGAAGLGAARRAAG